MWKYSLQCLYLIQPWKRPRLPQNALFHPATHLQNLKSKITLKKYPVLSSTRTNPVKEAWINSQCIGKAHLGGERRGTSSSSRNFMMLGSMRTHSCYSGTVQWIVSNEWKDRWSIRRSQKKFEKDDERKVKKEKENRGRLN